MREREREKERERDKMFSQVMEIRVNEQITELITEFPQTKVIDRKSGTIQVPVKNVKIPGLTLCVVLPKDYPKVCPHVTIMPANVDHPWMQKQTPGRVWHDSMQKFYYQHDEKALVKLVATLLDAFKAATVLGSNSGMATHAQNNNLRQQPQNKGPAMSLPTQDMSYEEIKKDLQSLPEDKLVELLTDKKAYASYLANMKQMSNMGSSMKELVLKNQALAESSLEKQNQIADVKNQIAIIRSTEVLEVKNKYEELAKEHNSILSSINVKTLKEKVSDAAAEADETSEGLSQKLMEKKISVENFIDEYCKSREIYHKRTMVLQSLDH